MNILLVFLLTIHVMVSFLMIIAVLMQRPRSEGLGAAFGGGMTDNIFGAQTTNVLAKATTILGITFFVLTLGIAMIYSRTGTQQTTIQRELMEMAPAVPAEAPTGAPGGTVIVDEVVVEPEVAPEATPVPEAATPVEETPPAVTEGDATPVEPTPTPE